MRIAFVLLFFFVAALLPGYGFDQQEKETIRKTFPAAKTLEVDNVWGSIRVVGYGGTGIELTAEKTLDADSAERMEAAKREVKLEITPSADRLDVYVDGPFRCHCEEGRRSVHENGHRGYRVRFDFELKVPVGTALRLATVNGGEIGVRNTSGDFNVENVNGGIDLNEVGGAGQVYAVNGKVNVAFARNPSKECSFKTINGAIEVAFQPGLSANVRVKTFNGHAYTDFEGGALPPAAGAAERRDGKFVYHGNGFSGFRIASGGPELKFDTLNGDIRILSRGK